MRADKLTNVKTYKTNGTGQKVLRNVESEYVPRTKHLLEFSMAEQLEHRRELSKRFGNTWNAKK